MNIFKILAPVALSLGATVPAIAQDAWTCWYTQAGQYSGQDQGANGGVSGQISRGSSANHYWHYVLSASQLANGEICPDTIDVTGEGSATTEAADDS